MEAIVEEGAGKGGATGQDVERERDPTVEYREQERAKLGQFLVRKGQRREGKEIVQDQEREADVMAEYGEGEEVKQEQILV